MAIPFDPTPGGASANSYGSLAEALAYFDSRLGGGKFRDASSDDIRKQVLIIGTRDIDQELYRGVRSSSTQALQFPRSGIYAGGIAIDPAIIPAFVKFASYEQGYWRLEQAGEDEDADPLAPSGTEELKSLGVGAVRLDFRDRDATVNGGRAADDPSRNLAPAAYRFLRDYILTESARIPDTGARNFSILRT